jgi:hypothetical protein
MKKSIIFIFLINLIFFTSYSQEKFYSENSGEFIFSFADVENEGIKVPNKMRFSLFLHLGQNYHYDFTNNFGFYSGYALRNIGFTIEEGDVKTKHRTYSLGIPLALKIGSFSDHFYIYGGGSYEMFFHYKRKIFEDGNKSKFSEWFSNKTDLFAPSFFAGVQFPKGINVKFKYYPNNFLNNDYKGDATVDYSSYNKSKLFYIALSFNIRTDKIKQLYNPESVHQAKFASLKSSY